MVELVGWSAADSVLDNKPARNTMMHKVNNTQYQSKVEPFFRQPRFI